MLAIGTRRTFHLLILFILIGLTAALVYAHGPYSFGLIATAVAAAIAFVLVTLVTWFTAARHRETDFSLLPVWVESGKPADKQDGPGRDND
jgi:hypothetical protein